MRETVFSCMMHGALEALAHNELIPIAGHRNPRGPGKGMNANAYGAKIDRGIVEEPSSLDNVAPTRQVRAPSDNKHTPLAKQACPL